MFRSVAGLHPSMRVACRTSDQVILSLIFGTFSALGDWLGILVFGAIANTRIVGRVVGGLLGGPLVGLGAGVLGAVPRYFMGGYTMWASVVANVAAGLISGTVHRRLGPQRIGIKVALSTGVLCELVLKALILPTYRFDQHTHCCQWRDDWCTCAFQDQERHPYFL